MLVTVVNGTEEGVITGVTLTVVAELEHRSASELVASSGVKRLVLLPSLVVNVDPLVVVVGALAVAGPLAVVVETLTVTGSMTVVVGMTVAGPLAVIVGTLRR